MKSTTKNFLKKIAWQIPTAGIVAYGVASNIYYSHQAQILPDTESAKHMIEVFKSYGETSKTVAELTLAYALVLDTVARAQANIEKKRHNREEEIFKKAKTMRPPPANIGLMVKPNYFETIEQIEEANKILKETQIFRVLNNKEKKTIGINEKQDVFATTRHIIIINGENTKNYINASASKATITDEETAKEKPLLKPVAIRMAIETHEYEKEKEARENWDEIYYNLYGKKLLKEALQEFKDPEKPITVIMDGSLALIERGCTVVPWGDYRYIGTDKIEGVEGIYDAAHCAINIIKTGIRDADRKKFVQFKPYEIKRLAVAIYAESELRKTNKNDKEISEGNRESLPKAGKKVNNEVNELNEEMNAMQEIDNYIESVMDREEVAEKIEVEITTKGINTTTERV